MPSATFTDLPLSPDLQENLRSLGYDCPTPIQSAALPAILEGRDVLGQAKTGSGKTAAFSLGFLQHLDVGNVQTQVLVLCPVRELADQVAAEIRRYRPPEPYKGKGVRYVDERVVIKEAKKK